MTDIYKTWVKDFGIDGFRIDTMKHVNDRVLAVVRARRSCSTPHQQGKDDFFMFGEVLSTRGASVHVALHDHTTAAGDARLPVPGRGPQLRLAGRRNTALADFFVNDDWYTDADSNAYELPTFLGNHDMGRIGNFLDAGQPRRAEAELLQRDELAHELMYFSRGNPVVYYGDEQGFTGADGGDQNARQDMFASQVATTRTPVADRLGADATRQDRLRHQQLALYQQIQSTWPQLPPGPPGACATAPQVPVRLDGPGVFAFSRMDRTQQREYVVALNNSETAQTAAVPTYVANRTFQRVYGAGAASLQTAADQPSADRHGPGPVARLVYERGRNDRYRRISSVARRQLRRPPRRPAAGCRSRLTWPAPRSTR